MSRLKFYNNGSGQWEYADLKYGPTGPMGPTGPSNGIKGDKGDPGDKGDQGDPGPAGNVTVTTDSTSTNPAVSLADSNQYIYTNESIVEVSVTLVSNLSAGFISMVVFKSRVPPADSTTFVITNTGGYTLKLRGDGLISGTTVYTPSASRTCTVLFAYDGINMNVYISEV